MVARTATVIFLANNNLRNSLHTEGHLVPHSEMGRGGGGKHCQFLCDSLDKGK